VRHTGTNARKWAAKGKENAAQKMMEGAVARIPELFRQLPLNPVKEMKDLSPWFADWLDHPDDSEYWDQWNIAQRHGKVVTPVYHLGGWFDGFLRGTIENYSGMRANAASELARNSQRLTIGPWVHAPNAADLSSCGEVEFGPDAPIGFFQTRLEWFDYWLKGVKNGLMDRPPVRLFAMGINKWREFGEWPPAGARITPMYLSGAKSSSVKSINDGSLSRQQPSGDETPDSYEYDPMRPVPTTGGAHLGEQNGPRDQRPIEAQVLSYTTSPLDRDLDVTGAVKAILYAKSSAKDTDWIVKITDVHPDGKSMLVCDGILRARYRKSRRKPELLNGQVGKYEIDLWGTSHVFRKGHRVRVLITSSDFPRWDRNMNTGGDNAREAKGVTALNTVYHDGSHPSHILLPVL
jgi:putative CocE/NonD family hydrolase